MKLKTKILAPVLTIAGLTATAAPLITLASCGSKPAAKLEIKVSGDDHYNNYSIIGEQALNKALTLQVSFKIGPDHSGWQTIGDESVITVGNKTLVLNTDYTIDHDSNKITIKAEAVNASQINVNIVSGPSIYMCYAWWDGKEELITIHNDMFLAGLPGQKITTENLIVYGIKGDKKSVVKATPGTAIGQYELFYDGENITKIFASQGFEFKEEMIVKTKNKPTQLPLRLKFHTQTGETTESMYIFCGTAPTSSTLDFEVQKSKASVTDLTKETEYDVVPEAGGGEYYHSKFEFVGDDLGCKLEPDEEGFDNWTLTTGTTAGKIKIKQTSYLDSSVTKEIEFEIKA